MSLPSTGWGAEGWGEDPWGGSDLGVLSLDGAIAVAENLVRAYFTETPYFSGLLDRFDASVRTHYAIAPVAGTVGIDGTPARAVAVLYARVGADQNSIELVLDRPLTPWPARYVLTTTGLASASTMTPADPDPATAGFLGLYREIVPPTVETATPSRDFANPQSPLSLPETSPLSPGAIAYGTYVVDETGDYAFDQGKAAYRKRILRRAFTRPGGFAHLPGYGVGIVANAKKLASPSRRAKLAADWRSQILQEPETASVTVDAITDPAHPGICWFVVDAKMKSGGSTKFKVPVAAV